MTRLRWVFLAAVLFFLGVFGGALAGQQPAEQQKDPTAPDLAALAAKPRNELAAVTRRFDADRGSLLRFYTIASSPTRHARLRRFYEDWSAALARLQFAALGEPARKDLKSLQKRVEKELNDVNDAVKAQAQIAPLVPFAPAIVALEESRQRMDKVDAAKAAWMLSDIKKQLARLSKVVAPPKMDDDAGSVLVAKAQATGAAETTAGLRAALKHWFNFYNEYDPVFSWWTADLYKEVDQALQAYAALLRDEEVRVKASALPLPIQAALNDLSNLRPHFPGKHSDAPDLATLLTAETSELREVVLRYQSDRNAFGKLGALPGGGKGAKSAEGKARLKKFCAVWLEALEKLDFDMLSRAGQVDYLLVHGGLKRELRRMEVEGRPPVKVKDASGIAGTPIGREALLVELAGEMIAYTPEELLALADREYDWCEAEMKKASREMGFGDDWRKAVEKVKSLAVAPGQQPALIRDLAWDAVAYVRKHDMVTVPPIAQETWRMEMMSPQRQLTSPFFLGGEVILVSYPTNTMSYEARLQSMRGNNPHFCTATVHHELIPGHHLQQFMNARYNTHRRSFGTPFWTEGWALYWELLLYEKGFARTPEDRVGFMFWRMHRCARIRFSLGFHTGKMTPKECIDYLVQRVHHEPANAEAEVRRSFQGNYGPLYQAAYLLGGLQIRALRKDLVGAAPGKMTDEQFHDAILQAGNMPIEMVRAALGRHKLTRDSTAKWRFYGELHPQPPF